MQPTCTPLQHQKLHNKIKSLSEQLKDREANVQHMKETATQHSTEYKKMKVELDEVKRLRQGERTQYKQSLERLKTHNVELMNELHGFKLRKGSPHSNGKELALKVQYDVAANYVKRLQEDLHKSNEKMESLQHVIETYQTEIEEYKNEVKRLNDMLLTEKEQKSDAVDLLNTVDLIKAVMKSANDITDYLNMRNNKKGRSSFDTQLLRLKNENNAVMESLTMVKLTTRCFEGVEKDLIQTRIDNNHKIQVARKNALKIGIKMKNILDDLTKNDPLKYRLATEESIRELNEFKKVNYEDFYKNETVLQEELIKKINNEKEFLNTIISKQEAL